jgi:hypothetical protein
MGVRTVLTTRRTTADDAARPSDRAAIGSALAGGLLIAAVVAARCGFSGPQVGSLPQVLGETGQPPHVQVGHQPRDVVSEVSVTARGGSEAGLARGASEAGPARANSEPAPASQPAQTADVAPGERLRVSGTDGQGVLLRTAPDDAGVTTRGFIEGWEVVVLERSGADWARVRGPNAQEGWIPTRYLSR